MLLAEPRDTPTSPQPPKPTPIAVLPSGLPIAEVIQRLTAIQQDHPDAEVRRGRADRWEIWPAKTTSTGPDPRSD
jgi:hypothetical protein